MAVTILVFTILPNFKECAFFSSAQLFSLFIELPPPSSPLPSFPVSAISSKNTAKLKSIHPALTEPHRPPKAEFSLPSINTVRASPNSLPPLRPATNAGTFLVHFLLFQVSLPRPYRSPFCEIFGAAGRGLDAFL